MSARPDVGTDEEGLEAERQATSMQDRLSKEAASWSKERRQRSSETVIAPSRSLSQRRSPQRAAKSEEPRRSWQGETTSAGSKPFSLSYDGMTQAQYVQYLLDRGAS